MRTVKKKKKKCTALAIQIQKCKFGSATAANDKKYTTKPKRWS